jgi:threonine synthase
VIKITGTYDQAKEVAADFAARRGITCDRGAKSIPGKESMKTIALEIAEQMGLALSTRCARDAMQSASKEWRAPDWYVQAVSGGIGPLGVLKGFVELYEAGLTDRVPKLAIVQSEGCAPMVRAWERGLTRAEPVQPDTLITVLATGKPGLAYEILKRACDQYGGAMVAVSDGEAFRAMRRVARIEGFSMEPASSVAFAGLEKLLANQIIQPGECVVVNCSGHTFSAEKHALEDRYVLDLQIEMAATSRTAGVLPVAQKPNGLQDSISHPSKKGLATALEQLDEQITTVVIIDDNPHDCRLIRRLLHRYKQYRTFEAYNGRDGLDLVRQRQPDLVILDLTLPDMDGFSILEALKADERTQEIPVVIVSAKSLTTDEEKHLYRYADSVWQKSGFSARDLVTHVIELVGGNGALAEPRGTVAQPVNVPPPPAVETFGQVRRSRILVIDDHEADARLMRRLLETRQRFDVVETHSGEQLLERLRARGETQDVPVIVVSARDIDPALRAQLTLQADSVWSKAVLDRSSLLAHVETILSV